MALTARAVASSSLKPRLLLVDDEPAVLETTAALLSDDYEVTALVGPTEAIAALGHSDFEVLCTDFRMPAMNGIELIRRAGTLKPLMSAVLVTGFSEYVVNERRPTDSFLLVVKPYNPGQLIEMVRRAAHLAKVRRDIKAMTHDLKLPTEGRR